MQIEFECLQHGRRFYRVRREGRTIFVGARDECARFLEIHRQKVAQAREDALGAPRIPPFAVRTYRDARRA